MGWNDEQISRSQGMKMSSKLLLAIIACIILIILIMFLLLINIKSNAKPAYYIYLDAKNVNTISAESLIAKIQDKTYINIEEFSKLVGYEYHKGEYKSFSTDEDKCYVQGKEETASFYLNNNKVYKVLVNKFEDEYDEYTVDGAVQSIEGKMYATVQAINKAFNVVINETPQTLEIYTLNYLVGIYDAKVKGWGYTGIAEQSFENKKSLLYGYFIVKRETGLYKVIDIDNTKEIVSDKYTAIQFSESTQEFLVTNSSGKVGIIDFNGKIKLDLIYESVELLDKESELYLIRQLGKYGVVKTGNDIIIYPEYDKIGINSNNNVVENKYLILDTLIPVCKNSKWGAYNKNGNLVINVDYEGFGYDLTNIELNGIKKSVDPILTIPKCNGIIVKQAQKYGVINIEGNTLVKIGADAIYGVKGAENENLRYFMLYNGKEYNVIEELRAAGYIKEDNNELTNTVVTNNK